MVIAEIIDGVLQKLYNEIKTVHGENADDVINERFTYLSKRYKNLVSGEESSITVDYSDPVTQFAYVYRYVTAYSDYIYQIIKNIKKVSSIFDDSPVKIALLGGGPGSDLLGVLKYLIRDNKNTNIFAQIFDKEKNWDNLWADLGLRICYQSEMKLFSSSRTINVTDPNTWSGYTGVPEIKLFTMSYFLSEIYMIRDESKEFFNFITNNAMVGSYFLSIDFYNKRVNSWVEEVFSNSCFKQVAKIDGIVNMCDDEYAKFNREFYNKFGARKVQANVQIYLYEKII